MGVDWGFYKAVSAANEGKKVRQKNKKWGTVVSTIPHYLLVERSLHFQQCFYGIFSKQELFWIFQEFFYANQKRNRLPTINDAVVVA